MDFDLKIQSIGNIASKNTLALVNSTIIPGDLRYGGDQLVSECLL